MEKKTHKFVWQEAELKDVLKFYASNYIPKKGKIINSEGYVDTAQGKVLFRLLVENDD